MARLSNELTYCLLANASSRAEARNRVAILGHWAEQQAERLDAGRALRLDHAAVVVEALHEPCAVRPTEPPAA